MPSFSSLSEPLSDGVIELRLAKEWDIPDILIAHQDDPELYRRLGMRRPPSGAELGRRAELDPAERASGRGLRLTILLAGDDTCRGQLDVHNVHWPEGEAELGIWVAPRDRGRGLATRALSLASDWVFTACGLQRLSLVTDPDNGPLLAAAKRSGFVAEPGQSPDRLSLTLVRRPHAPPTA
jgi:RimJ/RimL family protein N-acetyltransferase